MGEPMLIGWEAIARELYLHPKTAAAKKKYLFERGLIFERRVMGPRDRRARKHVCSYASIIRAYMIRNNGL